MKRIVLLFALSFLLCLVSVPAEEDVFAPFVSRIKVTPDGPRIKLTWNDSKDIHGRYIVYRYTEEINESNFRLTEEAGSVDEGVGFFFDTPPKYGQKYFYAVLAESDQGELYELFIPFRNKTVYAVEIHEVTSIENLSAGITSIRAEAGDDFIALHYTADKRGRELSIFRSISPIRGREDILDAELIALVSSSDAEYRDFAIPGIPYYYGIIDSEFVKAGNYLFKAGENSTPSSIEIVLQKNAVEDLPIRSRSRPLPVLTIDSTLTTGEALAVSPLTNLLRKPLAGDLAILVRDLTPKLPADEGVPTEPVMLETDRIRLATGESYSLGRVIDTAFMGKRWEEAEQRLSAFQKTKHPDDDDLRSHFYMGQVYYFQGKYHEAFYEFLIIRKEYHREATIWLDAVIKALS